MDYIKQYGYHGEIYSRQIEMFKRFSECEDYKHELTDFLLSQFDWKDKTVLEAGCGLGRFTDLYIRQAKKGVVTDRSSCMIESSRNRFKDVNSSFVYKICCHEDLKETIRDSFDFFLSAYSLCYSALLFKGEDFDVFLDGILPDDIKQYVIIENVGIFSEADSYLRPFHKYYEALSKRFERKVFRTDYSFESVEEACFFTNIYFGEKVSRRVLQSGSRLVPELTAVWYNSI